MIEDIIKVVNLYPLHMLPYLPKQSQILHVCTLNLIAKRHSFNQFDPAPQNGPFGHWPKK